MATARLQIIIIIIGQGLRRLTRHKSAVNWRIASAFRSWAQLLKLRLAMTVN